LVFALSVFSPTFDWASADYIVDYADKLSVMSGKHVFTVEKISGQQNGKIPE